MECEDGSDLGLRLHHKESTAGATAGLYENLMTSCSCTKTNDKAYSEGVAGRGGRALSPHFCDAVKDETTRIARVGSQARREAEENGEKSAYFDFFQIGREAMADQS